MKDGVEEEAAENGGEDGKAKEEAAEDGGEEGRAEDG